MTVRYTPEAIHDLQALRDYIGKILGNPKAASRIAKLILDTCGQLKNHPQLGASVEAKTGHSTDLRFVICEKWLAFYRIDENIISVMDGRTTCIFSLEQIGNDGKCVPTWAMSLS